MAQQEQKQEQDEVEVEIIIVYPDETVEAEPVPERVYTPG